MKSWMKKENIHLTSHRKIQFLLLLVLCAVEALFVTTEGMFRFVGYYLVESYIAIPCFLFLGTLLGHRLSGIAKFNLCLSGAAVLWFVMAQIQHKAVGMQPVPASFFFLSYLMGFPFAAVTEDQKNSIGMKLISSIFLLAALVLAGYGVLLVLNFLPEPMRAFIYWDGTRLHPLWHPNIGACIFMIGIGISLAYMFHTQRTWKKVLLVASVVLQFFAMSLTNCRTSIMMTCVLVGFSLFLAFFKGDRKRLLAGISAALAATAILFATAGQIYDLNRQQHVEKFSAQQQASEENQESTEVTGEVPLTESVQQETAELQPTEEVQRETSASQPTEETKQDDSRSEKTGDIAIPGNSNQGTLKDDLKNLNGRTRIWRAARAALKSDRSMRWWGTEYIGTMLSAQDYITIEHSHNSWIEMLMGLGLPGLMISLVYTGIALWSIAVILINGAVERWKKMIAVLIMCILIASFLEPFLFFTKIYYQFIDFCFFFMLGYLDLWRRQVLHPEQFPEG